MGKSVLIFPASNNNDQHCSQTLVCPWLYQGLYHHQQTEKNNTNTRNGKEIVSEEYCAELQRLENAAFAVCEHEGEGFTWQEVEDCEDYVMKISLINNIEMPTKEDFDSMDVN